MTQESTPQPTPDIIDRIPTQDELVARNQALEAAMPDDPNWTLNAEQFRMLREHAGVTKKVGGAVLPKPVEVKAPETDQVFEPYVPRDIEMPVTRRELRAMAAQIEREDAER